MCPLCQHALYYLKTIVHDYQFENYVHATWLPFFSLNDNIASVLPIWKNTCNYPFYFRQFRNGILWILMNIKKNYSRKKIFFYYHEIQWFQIQMEIKATDLEKQDHAMDI